MHNKEGGNGWGEVVGYLSTPAHLSLRMLGQPAVRAAKPTCVMCLFHDRSKSSRLLQPFLINNKLYTNVQFVQTYRWNLRSNNKVKSNENLMSQFKLSLTRIRTFSPN